MALTLERWWFVPPLVVLVCAVLFASPAHAAPVTTMLDDRSAELTFAGTWQQAGSTAAYSETLSLVSGAGNVGASVTHSSAPTAGSVWFMAARHDGGGLVEVVINGAIAATVDTYGTTAYQTLYGPWTVAIGDSVQLVFRGAGATTGTPSFYFDALKFEGEPPPPPPPSTEVTSELVEVVAPRALSFVTWSSAFFVGMSLIRKIGGEW